MKILEIKPLLNHVVTTADVYEESENLLLGDDTQMAGAIKEFQRVVAVGPNVKNVEVGDMVAINPSAYARPSHRSDDSVAGFMGKDEVQMFIQFPVLDINDTPHLFIYDRDIDYVVTKWE